MRCSHKSWESHQLISLILQKKLLEQFHKAKLLLNSLPEHKCQSNPSLEITLQETSGVALKWIMPNRLGFGCLLRRSDTLILWVNALTYYITFCPSLKWSVATLHGWCVHQICDWLSFYGLQGQSLLQNPSRYSLNATRKYLPKNTSVDSNTIGARKLDSGKLPLSKPAWMIVIMNISSPCHRHFNH